MSANKAYVGNLPFTFTQVDLQELFQGFGPVRSAQIITDRETGRSRGFGFVEMETPEALAQAIAGLHERNVQGRNLTVNEARERVPGAPRPSGGFGGPRPGGPSFRPAGAPSFSGDQGGGGPGRGRHDRGGGGERERSDRDRGGERGRGKRGRGRDDNDDGY